jgi:hypothetical protein
VPASSSVTRTIRIERDVDEFLRKFAEREGISVNFLVNKAIRRLVEWDVFAEKFGMVALPGSLLVKVMDSLSDGEAADLGEWVGKNLLPEFLTFWFKEASLQTVVMGYSRLSARYARAFEYEERAKEGKWTVVFKHGSGMRWSRYYEALVRTALGGLLKGAEIKTERTDDQVIARFSLT